MAQNIYDDPAFFAGYSELPRSAEGLNAAPEWPTLRSMLPDPAGKRVLDLGCGFGAFARWAEAAGATAVVGIDISERMLARARQLTRGTVVSYHRADLAQLEPPPGRFEVVYSSLAFHYLPECEDLLRRIRSRQHAGDRLVFSVEHPIYTAPSNAQWQTLRDREVIWPLNNYLNEGQRVTDWIVGGVVKYHRTVERYVANVLGAGYALTRLVEWRPSETDLTAHPEWANEVHRPMFLLVGATAV